MRAPRFVSRVLPFLGLALGVHAPVGAEEDDPRLVRRMFDVGALTLGQTNFIPEAMGLVSPWIDREEAPLFGAESEEPILPYGTVDELIELVKNTVDPASWAATEGAEIKVMGDLLFVTHRSQTVDRVAQHLSALDAARLVPALVEVRVVRVQPGEGAFAVEALTAEPGALTILLTALHGQRAAGFSGAQRAYVASYEASSAPGGAGDPVVGVLNLGLTAIVTPLVAHADATASVEVFAEVAQLDGLPTRETSAGPVQTPVVSGARVRSLVRLSPGRWRVLDGAASARSGWVFLARIVPRRVGEIGSAESAAFAPRRREARGATANRAFDVADLTWWRPCETESEIAHLWPTGWSTPAATFACPGPIFQTEALVELVKEVVGFETWSGDDAQIDARNDLILVRAEPSVIETASDVLDVLRSHASRRVGVIAEVLSMAPAVAGRLFDPTTDFVLGKTEKTAIDVARAAGDVESVEVLRASCGVCDRVPRASGRRVTYLQDVDLRGEEDRVTPISVTRSVFDGVLLDLQACVTPSGDATNVAIRFTRSELARPLPTTKTPVGEIDVPNLALVRFRTNVRAPFGMTSVVGLASDGEKTTILLLTPTLERD